MNTQIEFVKVETLKPSPWNPDMRIRNVRGLEKSMQRDGFWPYCPLWVYGDNFIADGHRRWTAAQHVGIQEVPIMRIEKDGKDLWRQGHEETRPITPKEGLAATAIGGIVVAPTRLQPRLKKMIDILGVEGFGKLASLSISPNIYGEARTTAKYCGMLDDDEFIGTVIHWMVDHGMQYMCKVARKQGIPVDLLMQRIANNEPLRLW